MVFSVPTPVRARKRRRIAGVSMVLSGLALMIAGVVAAPSISAQAQMPNKGDVWTQNVGNDQFPGHQQDPKLTCTDINVWAYELKASEGTFVVDSWPPTGGGQDSQAYPGDAANPSTEPWTYDTEKGGSQIVATISIDTLMANSAANGDELQNSQGFHFKLFFDTGKQIKHKTFWVDCEGGGGGSPTPTPTTATPTPTGTEEAVTSTPTPGSPTPTASVQAITTPGTGADGLSSGISLTGFGIFLLGWMVLVANSRIRSGAIATARKE